MVNANGGRTDIDPLLGQIINDRFEVIEHIARGGMGSVYRARQRPLGREVALKVLAARNDEHVEGAEFDRRFFLEAATAAKLSHPNTVTIFDYGVTDGGLYFMAMELVEGVTLSSLLRQGPLEARRAALIAVQIARSLREAHALGVIHRDLKPGNVFITRHGDDDAGADSDFVKVFDFGLVKELETDEELTRAGLFMGSPKYMAPEQIEGTAVDGRADLYALGVTLYHMLTGRVPFHGSSQMTTLIGHVREAVPPMRREDGEPIPDALIEITMRCLEKRPDARYPSMQELINALKEAVDGGPMLASGSYRMGAEAALSPAGGVALVSPAQGFTPAGGFVRSGERSIYPGSMAPPPSRKGVMAASVGLLLGLGAAGGWWFTQTPTQPAQVAPTAAPTTPPEAPVETPTTPPEVAPPAAPAEAAPSVLQSVVVDVGSTPMGATVLINGTERGTTPLSVQLLGAQAGEGAVVEVELRRRGYAPYRLVRVVTGENISVSPELVRVGRRTGRGMRPERGVPLDPGYRPPTNDNYRQSPY